MDIYFDFSEYETAQAGATLALGGRPDVGLHLARMPESGLAFGGCPLRRVVGLSSVTPCRACICATLLDRRTARDAHTRSRISAMPWPTPMHMVHSA